MAGEPLPRGYPFDIFLGVVQAPPELLSVTARAKPLRRPGEKADNTRNTHNYTAATGTIIAEVKV